MTAHVADEQRAVEGLRPRPGSRRCSIGSRAVGCRLTRRRRGYGRPRRGPRARAERDRPRRVPAVRAAGQERLPVAPVVHALAVVDERRARQEGADLPAGELAPPTGSPRPACPCCRGSSAAASLSARLHDARSRTACRLRGQSDPRGDRRGGEAGVGDRSSPIAAAPGVAARVGDRAGEALRPWRFVTTFRPGRELSAGERPVDASPGSSAAAPPARATASDGERDERRWPRRASPVRCYAAVGLGGVDASVGLLASSTNASRRARAAAVAVPGDPDQARRHAVAEIDDRDRRVASRRRSGGGRSRCRHRRRRGPGRCRCRPSGRRCAAPGRPGGAGPRRAGSSGRCGCEISGWSSSSRRLGARSREASGEPARHDEHVRVAEQLDRLVRAGVEREDDEAQVELAALDQLRSARGRRPTPGA